VHTTYNAKKYAKIYLDQIVCLHGASLLGSGNNFNMLLELS
jgi:hypothetical protein